MPRISEYFGITISMYYNDHEPAHFHATYAEHEAVVAIGSMAMLQGYLPPRPRSFVLEWSWRHRDALLANWVRARAGLPLERIRPLE